MHIALLFDCVDIIIGFAYIINNTVILLFIFLSKEINFILFSLVIISLLHFLESCLDCGTLVSKCMQISTIF